NLLPGSHKATDEECVEALRLSNLLPTSVSPEVFLDTEIGENGVLLSGGERQRLAIARALLPQANTRIWYTEDSRIRSSWSTNNSTGCHEPVLGVTRSSRVQSAVLA